MISGGMTTASEDGDYISIANRGGLIRPSDLLSMVSLHTNSFWKKIHKKNALKEALMGMTNPKEVFVGTLTRLMKDDPDAGAIMKAKCNNGHEFKTHVSKIIGVIFNACARNLAEEHRSSIHASKKRVKDTDQKSSSSTRKRLKLTSGGASIKAPDCGTCKFCLDKKKNGGKGTLKKKCINK